MEKYSMIPTIQSTIRYALITFSFGVFLYFQLRHRFKLDDFGVLDALEGIDHFTGLQNDASSNVVPQPLLARAKVTIANGMAVMGRKIIHLNSIF